MVLRASREEIVLTVPLHPSDMRYTGRPSHLAACPTSGMSSACPGGSGNMEAHPGKAGSLQWGPDCPHHRRCTEPLDCATDAGVASLAADGLGGTACGARRDPPGCSCGPSCGCGCADSQDSGYLSQDSGYLSPLNQSVLSAEDEGTLAPGGELSAEGRAGNGEQPWDWTSGDDEEEEEEEKKAPADVLSARSVAEGPGLEAKPASPHKKSPGLSKWHLLPALQVGWAVCQSMGRARGKPGVDQSLLKQTLLGQTFSIENLIGRKMGLERVDIWKELSERGFPLLLSKLLRFLSGADLLNCVKVSKTWRKIISDDRRASQSLKKASRLRRVSAADSLGDTATRRNTVSRGALSSVQRVGLNSPRKNSAPRQPLGLATPGNASQKSIRHQQVVKTLKWDETLKICPQCASPAKFFSCQQRAVCSSERCSYDYCSLCFCAYHGSKDCVRRHFINCSKSQPQAGSKKSKRNLQRL
uniref:F-box only protein 5 n=1 Tax=Pristiophorus japonicus TaxID=55135 RepID=UPI00398EBBC7